MIMKAPKHLLGATEVKTYRNGVKTYHVKMLNVLTSYSNQSPLFFIIQDCVNQRKAIFYLRSYLATSFLYLKNVQVSTLVKLDKLRQKQFVNKLFSLRC